MAKKSCDFSECLVQAVQAFDDKRVLLVSLGVQGVPNAMALGWGSLGIIWRRPVFTMLLHAARYSHDLITQTGEFTVNILPPGMEKVVQYCGSVSGRDVDKLATQGLTALPASRVKVPIIREGIIHFECQVIYTSDLHRSGLAKPVLAEIYGEKKEPHRLFCGEIVNCERD